MLNGATFGATLPLGVMPCWGELEELDPLLPGSEQFKLQQSRAIEAPGVLLADCAFLQQSGMPAIEPSRSCAPALTAPPRSPAMRVKTVNHFRIVGMNILRGFVDCQARTGTYQALFIRS